MGPWFLMECLCCPCLAALLTASDESLLNPFSAVIARSLMVITSRVHGSRPAGFQFKNAVMILAAEATILVPDDPRKTVNIFSVILEMIARVKYYRPGSPGPPQPRISKIPPDKWFSQRRKNPMKLKSKALWGDTCKAG